MSSIIVLLLLLLLLFVAVFVFTPLHAEIIYKKRINVSNSVF